MDTALKGLKVVEVGNILAGPFVGTMLGDFGAEVIKVEPPKTGDLMRNMGRIKDFWYCVEGRNKKDITLNLKTAEGKDLLWKLIKDADILVQNFRPGVFDRLGFTWEKLQEVNPRLVYVVASGYGSTGPKAKLPGMDRIGLAAGGFLQVTGFPDMPPIKPGISTADFFCALFGVSGAMFAIYSRDVLGTGRGQKVDCCLTESMLRLQESIIAEYSYDGAIRERIGNAALVTVPSGHFLTKDNKYLVVTVSGDKLFKKCMELMGREDLITDPRCINGGERTKNRDFLNNMMAEWVKAHTIEECINTFGDEVPNCKVYNAKDIVEDEHFKTRNMIVDVPTDKFGVIKMQNAVPQMSGTPGKIQFAGKPLGYFNEEILGERYGLSKEKLAEYKEKGII